MHTRVHLNVQHHVQALLHLRVEEIVPREGKEEILPMEREEGEGEGREERDSGVMRGREKEGGREEEGGEGRVKETFRGLSEQEWERGARRYVHVSSCI